jgi:predicted MFS family arabinose efflux permease
MNQAHSQSAAPDQPLNWPTAFVMLSGGLMVTIAMAALTPVLPQIQDALAHSDHQKLLVKMLVPIIGATMVVGAPLTGYLIDRLRMRSILITYCIIFGVGGTAGLYLSDLYALLFTRLLVGLGAAGIATISMTLINTRLDGNGRARWMGYHVSTAMFGSLLVHPVVGALGELGWRWPFIMYAAGLIIAAVAMAGLQDPKLLGSAERSERASRVERNPLKWFPLWFLPFALAMGAVTYLPNVYLGFVVREVGVSSPSVIALVMLADAILGACMALLFGRSQRYISSTAAFIFSFSCTGTGLLIVSLAPSFTVVVVGMLVFGFGIGWFVPNLMTAVARRVSQQQQGQAVGIIKAAHYLASPLAILAVEPIARLYGPTGATATGSALSFCVVAAMIFVAATEARRVSGKPPASVPAE